MGLLEDSMCFYRPLEAVERTTCSEVCTHSLVESSDVSERFIGQHASTRAIQMKYFTAPDVSSH